MWTVLTLSHIFWSIKGGCETVQRCLSAAEDLWGGLNRLFTTTDTQGPWMSVTSPHSFFTFKSPYPMLFLDSIRKNQRPSFPSNLPSPALTDSLHEHWQIVIFWPVSQRRVERGRRADKRLLPFTTAHYWPFRRRCSIPKAGSIKAAPTLPQEASTMKFMIDKQCFQKISTNLTQVLWVCMSFSRLKTQQ